MKKTVLVLLGLLAISLVITGCAEPQTVDLTDEEGNVVGQAVRYSPGKYKSPGVVKQCVPKTVAELCPLAATGTLTAGNVLGSACGSLSDGCGSQVNCGSCVVGDLAVASCVANKCTNGELGLTIAKANKFVPMLGLGCQDSDGGVVPSVKGTVSLLDKLVVVSSLSDTCTGGNLIELSCYSGDKLDQLMVNSLVTCKYGCADGACQIG